MRILKVEKIKYDKKHVKLTLGAEGESPKYLVCPAIVLESQGLAEGSEVHFEKVQAAASEAEGHLADEIALRKLSYASRSEKEIKNALKSKNVTKEAATATMEKLKRYSLVDDKKFAAEFIRFSKYGKLKIVYILTAEKGIDAKLVSELVDELLDDEAEEEKALKAAEKCATAAFKSKKDPERRLFMHLLSKGFENRVAARAVKKILGATVDE